METIMKIKDDIHAIYHTFLYKNNGQISASQKNLTVLQNSNFSTIKIRPINLYRYCVYRHFARLTVVRDFLQFRNFSRRRQTMKLQDKHNEFAVRYYTNITSLIVLVRCGFLTEHNGTGRTLN